MTVNGLGGSRKIIPATGLKLKEGEMELTKRIKCFLGFHQWEIDKCKGIPKNYKNVWSWFRDDNFTWICEICKTIK